MKLATTVVSPGQLVVVKDGAPKSNDFSNQYIVIGGYKLPAFVDGTDLIARCSKEIPKGSYPVTVNSEGLGRVLVDSV